MYNQTEAQQKAEALLEKQGFRFSNWISAHDGDPESDKGVMVFTRKPTRHTTEYREVEPDGTIL